MTVSVTDREATYEPSFYDDLCAWRDEDLSTAQRVVELIELVMRHPKKGRGRPKRLAELPGVWSRRITRTHRLFYLAKGDVLHFIACRGHEFPDHLRPLIREGRTP